MRYFIDIFDEMMDNIQSEYDTINVPVETPYGMYGSRHEICQLLTEKDESQTWKFKKYPLIILYSGQDEERGTSPLYDFEVSPLFSIVTDSSRNFRESDRYTNSVKPILDPIYELLLDEISKNPYLWQSYPEEIEHTYKVWNGNPSDNKEAGLMFNDYLDGIDIQITNLRVFTNVACV